MSGVPASEKAYRNEPLSASGSCREGARRVSRLRPSRSRGADPGAAISAKVGKRSSSSTGLEMRSPAARTPGKDTIRGTMSADVVRNAAMSEVSLVLAEGLAVIGGEDHERFVEQAEAPGKAQDLADVAIRHLDIGIVLCNIMTQAALVAESSGAAETTLDYLVTLIEGVAEKGVLDPVPGGCRECEDRSSGSKQRACRRRRWRSSWERAKAFTRGACTLAGSRSGRRSTAESSRFRGIRRSLAPSLDRPPESGSKPLRGW